MIRIKQILFKVPLILLATIFINLQAQSKLSDSKLSSLLEEISKYEYGDSRIPLSDFDFLVKESLNDQISTIHIESSIIEYLNGDCTFDGKQYLCTKLALIGTELSIPKLIDMTEDSTTSDIALFSLENISSILVEEELLKVIDNVDQNTRIGIVNILATRNTDKLLSRLEYYVLEDNNKLAIASAYALGKYKNESATELIFVLLQKTQGKVYRALLDSYLKCADVLIKQNKNVFARKIYKFVLEDSLDTPQKLAAIKGLINSFDDERDSVIISLLKSDSPKLIEVALSQLLKINSETGYKSIEDSFETFSSGVQANLLNTISSNKIHYFLPLARKACMAESVLIRAEGINCIENLGNGEDVELLLNLTSDSEPLIKSKSVTALYNLIGSDVDAEILNRLTNSELQHKIELIKAVRARRIYDGFDSMIDMAVNKHPRIRVESYQTLGVISMPEQLPTLISLFNSITNNKELKPFENALARITLKNPEVSERGDVFIETLSNEENLEKKKSLLRILGATGDEDAYKIIKNNLSSNEADLTKTAIQSLYNWPNLEPLDDLIEIVESGNDETNKILALRGYINLLNSHHESYKDDILEYYEVAIRYSNSEVENNLILSGLSKIFYIDAIKLALQYLNTQQKAEAEIAIIEIALRTRWSYPNESYDALSLLLENPSSAEVETSVNRLLNKIVRK